MHPVGEQLSHSLVPYPALAQCACSLRRFNLNELNYISQ